MARSGPLLDNQSDSLTLSLNLQAGQGAFWYRVSSEPAFGADGDYFDFVLNGTNLVHAAGESGWVQYSFPVPAGSNTLAFSYTKDSAFSENLDAAFIDNLELPVVVPKDSTTPALISASRVVGSDAQIFIQGQTNQLYWIQASSDLFNWITISTNIATHGVIQITDPNPLSTNLPTRFYRIAAP
jgi:hypothetical protein